MNIKSTVKMALENTVMSRGALGAKAAYEYAERMESVIIEKVIETLRHALENTNDLDTCVREIIDDLENR
jgi:hypothetical protein